METVDLSRLHAYESWADLFDLLALSLRLPTEELAEGMKSGAFEEDVQALFGELELPYGELKNPEGVYAGDSCELKNVLRRSYTELFTHPLHPRIAITESRFCDARGKKNNPSMPFLNETALHAEQCYHRAGLQFSSDMSREPADHMSMELEFLSYLHTQCAAALVRENVADLELWERRLQEFRPHLEAWASDFFAACSKSESGVFYSWLGRWGKISIDTYLAR